MRRAALLAVPLVLLPELAQACAGCLSSPFGDRTFNWAHLLLLGMPFAVTAAVGGILAWTAGVRPRHLLEAATGRRRPRAGPRRGDDAHLDKETT